MQGRLGAIRHEADREVCRLEIFRFGFDRVHLSSERDGKGTRNRVLVVLGETVVKHGNSGGTYQHLHFPLSLMAAVGQLVTSLAAALKHRMVDEVIVSSQHSRSMQQTQLSSFL